jgi:outer membrane receptor protein involved in Fe transport
MIKLISSFTLTLFLSANLLLAGTTGKISGVIQDAETGEPLPGVNIQLAGTTMGGVTDMDGIFFILNIPPGLYTLEFTYIGFQTVVMKEVRVNVDFTTRVEQKMNPTVIEGAVVEVYGERNPLVRADLTNTRVVVTSEVIDELPVVSINDVIALQAGVVQDNSGALHIRGGRSDEISFQVNGFSINNTYSNSQGVGLATNAIEEVSVSAGTFSAEYGNALSGVINYVTKDGGPKWHGSARAWSGDHVSNHTDIFFNIDDMDPVNDARAEWTLGGPVPFLNKKVTLFTSGVWQRDLGHLYGIRVYTTDDLLFSGEQGNFAIDPFGFRFVPGPDGTVRITANPNESGASGDRAIVPMVTREAINITAKLSWKMTNNLKLSYDLIYDDGERFNRTRGSVSLFRRFRFTPDGRPKTTSRNSSHSIGISHTLSSKTFYTLKFGVNFNEALTAVFDDPLDQRNVPAVTKDIADQIIPPTDTYVAGATDPSRTKENAKSIIVKFDAVSQVLPNHEVRFGGDYAYHRMDYEAYTLLWEEEGDLLRFFIPYPELNPNFTSYQSYLRKPVQASAYILDKMELAHHFIFNAGLRYEFYHTQAPYNPDLAGTVDSPEGVSNAKFLKESDPKHRLMPRLHLSFPITDRGIIRFSYGTFYQYPNLRSAYRNPRFEDLNFIATPSFGNANLEPERSIQYELGLQQQFTEDLKLDVTVFYKDVTNLIGDQRIVAGEVAVDKNFNVYTNVSFTKVRGFTLSFLKRRSAGDIFSASLDYTFQVGEGSFTDPLDLAVDTRTGRQTPQKMVPLGFTRSHTLNTSLIFGKAHNWTASAIGYIWTGTPYTPSLPSSLAPTAFEVNSDNRPLNANVDLRLEKFFNLNLLRFSVFLQVFNLFDTMNERFIHENTGRSLTNLNKTTNPTLFDNLRKEIQHNPDDYFPEKFLNDFYQREDWLSEPRRILLGLTFNF